MILNIFNNFFLFETQRATLIEAVLSKFSHFQVFSYNENTCCKVIEILPNKAVEILNRYNISCIEDTYNIFISPNKNIFFESYGFSFVLTDRIDNKIYYSIEETRWPTERTIIIRLLHHLLYYLIKNNLYSIHCSCTTVNNDPNNCVAFLGNKHSGKTTLAFHLYATGESIICDDSLIFDSKTLASVPNNSLAKAYLDDIKIIESKNIKTVKTLHFDNDKYQVLLSNEKFAPCKIICPQTIFIINDNKSDNPQVKLINQTEFVIEALKKTTINEYFSEPGYLELLNHLSKKKCYYLTPSVDSQKTYEYIHNIIY